MADAPAYPDSVALHRLAYSQEGLFTARQAQERGYSAQLLAHHARTGRFARVRRGLYRLPAHALRRGWRKSKGRKHIPHFAVPAAGPPIPLQ